MNNNMHYIPMVPARSFPDTQPNIEYFDQVLYDCKTPLNVALYGYINTTDDIFRLAMYVEVLRESYGVGRIDLVTPRIPWDRMDRRMNVGTPFSLRIIADFLNSLQLGGIHTLCPHSIVAQALIPALRPAPLALFDLVDSLYEKHLSSTHTHLNLVSPDLGGVTRVKEVRAALAQKYPSLTTDLVVLSKERSSKGESVQCEVLSFPHNEKAPYIIIDDLCDGGATFLEAFKVLEREYESPSVHLCIAHGLFTNPMNFMKITGLFETVYCYAAQHEEHKQFPNLYVTDGCDYLIRELL